MLFFVLILKVLYGALLLRNCFRRYVRSFFVACLSCNTALVVIAFVMSVGQHVLVGDDMGFALLVPLFVYGLLQISLAFALRQ